MSFMGWDGSLDLGHAIIDQDHRSIVESIERLMEAIANPVAEGQAAESRIAAAIAEVRETTEKHFRSEEWIMAASDYPGTAAHRNQHIDLLAEFDHFARLLHQTQGDDAAPVARYLREWLEVHLQVWDASLVRWLDALDPDRDLSQTPATTS
jgi:hemerythrin